VLFRSEREVLCGRVAQAQEGTAEVTELQRLLKKHWQALKEVHLFFHKMSVDEPGPVSAYWCDVVHRQRRKAYLNYCLAGGKD